MELNRDRKLFSKKSPNITGVQIDGSPVYIHSISFSFPRKEATTN